MVQIDDFGSELDILCVLSNKCTYVWILDAGYSYHMKSNREWFTTFRIGNFGFIYLGGDKACTITRMIQIKIYMDDGNLRTLTDLRYIIELRKNLISLGTLQKKCFSYRYDGDIYIMKVHKGVTTLMKARRTTVKIYKLLGNIVVGDVA